MIVVNIYLSSDRTGKYSVFAIITIMINSNLIVCIVLFVLFFFVINS